MTAGKTLVKPPTYAAGFAVFSMPVKRALRRGGQRCLTASETFCLDVCLRRAGSDVNSQMGRSDCVTATAILVPKQMEFGLEWHGNGNTGNCVMRVYKSVAAVNANAVTLMARMSLMMAFCWKL